MNPNSPNFEVTDTELDYSTPTSFLIRWGTKSAGFGEVSFTQRMNELQCDNECMSRRFVKSVLEHWMHNHIDQYISVKMHLLDQYKSIDALLDASIPTQATQDWKRP